MPPYIAVYVLQPPREAHLCVKFVGVMIARIGGVHRALGVLPDIELGFVADGGVPPFGQMAAWSGFKVEAPVELRHHIVHPSLVGPEEDVGVEVVVIL